MKGLLMALALIGALTLPYPGKAADYTVDRASSTLGFAATFQGSQFTGQFGQWHAAIRYDPAHLDHSRFDVTVDMTSVDTGDADRDQALPGADFFNAMAYPTAHFVTTGFRQGADRQVMADGQLTLRGVTRPISLAVAFAPQPQGAVLDATGTLNRLDFGVGGGEYADTSVIGATVTVNAHLVLQSR